MNKRQYKQAHWTYDAWLEWFSLTEKIQSEEDSPYCTECQACGEEGCCSPLNCSQSENGSYCKSYLKDLKFGYHMNQWVEENLINDFNPELKKKYDEEWNKAYDLFYK